MKNNLAPWVRIGLRIFGGYLIGKGYASEADVAMIYDPEVQGVIIIAVSEGWYLLSKRFGWAT